MHILGRRYFTLSIVAALALASLLGQAHSQAPTVGGVTQAAPAPTLFPAVPRAYQPQLTDPGLDGGRNASFSRGDVSPDGRLLIAFRSVDVSCYLAGDPTCTPRSLDDPGDLPPVFRLALVASLVDPEDLNTNTSGYLTGFYDPDSSFVVGSGWNVPYGEDFFVGDNGEVGRSEIIHQAFEIIEVPTGQTCTTNSCFTCTGSTTEYMLDPNYPQGGIYGSAHMTVAFHPDSGVPSKQNPYPSDEFGNYKTRGSHLTYRLRMVRTQENLEVTCLSSDPVKARGINDTETVPVHFVAQDLTVVVKKDYSEMVLAEAEPFADGRYFEELTFDDQGSPSNVRGIECSMTSEGRLIFYHGAGTDNQSATPGSTMITYVYNDDPTNNSGWSAPKSVTTLHYEYPTTFPEVLDASNMVDPVATLELFRRTYAVAKHPIREMPITGADPLFADGYIYQATDDFAGAYPWLSRDGSFFMTVHTQARDSDDAAEGGSGPSTRMRAANIVCGDITGGYVKLVDDIGVNPTRLGGFMHWPWYDTIPDLPNSWRTVVFTSGLKPGLWQPLLGEDLPFPTQHATQGVPIMPLMNPKLDLYGEIRFQEADGHYLFYLGCNEAFRLNPLVEPHILAGTSGVGDMYWSQATGRQSPFVIDTKATPDTSGRTPRAVCDLNADAAFPQESITGVGDPAERELLRKNVATTLGITNNQSIDPQYHENLGFNGQAIMFRAGGAVTVQPGADLNYGNKLTVQAFVKVLPGWNNQGVLKLVEDGGVRYALWLRPDNTVLFGVQTTTGIHFQVSTPLPITAAATPYDPTEGWFHLLATYDGAANGTTRLRLFVDGQPMAPKVIAGESSLILPSGSQPIQVGPNLAGGGANAPYILMLDEVAVSNVVRNAQEIARDAHVSQPPSGFTEWPAAAPNLPRGLDPAEAKWPVGLTYDATKIDLGDDLFASKVLGTTAADRSCTSCHKENRFFTENLAKTQLLTSPAPHTTIDGLFNTPTIINAVFGTHKFFDGRAATLEDQVLQPLIASLTSSEMGDQDVVDVVARLNDNTELDPAGVSWVSRFQTAFSTASTTPVTDTRLAEVLAMYIRTENVANAPFDKNVMNGAERRGLGIFMGKGRCVTCHHGSAFSDDSFHNIFTVPDDSGVEGRGGFTERSSELGQIKTPTLREIRWTGPYFHDGSATTLMDVVNHYSEGWTEKTHPLGEPDRFLRPLLLTGAEKSDLVAFLKSLSSNTLQMTDPISFP